MIKYSRNSHKLKNILLNDTSKFSKSKWMQQYFSNAILDHIGFNLLIWFNSLLYNDDNASQYTFLI